LPLSVPVPGLHSSYRRSGQFPSTIVGAASLRVPLYYESRKRAVKLDYRHSFMRSIAKQFFRHVIPSVIRPLHILWNEMIGFLFLVFAVVPIPRTWKTWRQYEQTGEGLFSVALSVVFILIMAGFGIGSFRRARKISHS
jgi:hypothetical protein